MSTRIRLTGSRSRSLLPSSSSASFTRSTEIMVPRNPKLWKATRTRSARAGSSSTCKIVNFLSFGLMAHLLLSIREEQTALLFPIKQQNRVQGASCPRQLRAPCCASADAFRGARIKSRMDLQPARRVQQHKAPSRARYNYSLSGSECNGIYGTRINSDRKGICHFAGKVAGPLVPSDCDGRSSVCRSSTEKAVGPRHLNGWLVELLILLVTGWSCWRGKLAAYWAVYCLTLSHK